jgi:hypothetical protein
MEIDQHVPERKARGQNCIDSNHEVAFIDNISIRTYLQITSYQYEYRYTKNHFETGAIDNMRFGDLYMLYMLRYIS